MNRLRALWRSTVTHLTLCGATCVFWFAAVHYGALQRGR